MRAISIESRLKPNPAIAIFGIGKGLGNGKFHRVTSGHGNIDFALAKLYRITNGIAANIGNAGPFANQRQLGWRFMYTLLHNRG